MKITVFKTIRQTDAPLIRDLSVAIERIKKGKTKFLIEQIRKESDKKKRDELKSNLPSYCFGGEFSYRSTKGLIQASGLMCIDFDGFKSFDDAKSFKDTLIKDPYIHVAFISPSGIGVKALIVIPIVETNEDYNLYFEAFGKYINHDKWDDNNKGISRVCYESFDPEIYINDNAEMWTSQDVQDIEDIGVTNPIIAVTSENRIISNLLTWFNRKYPMNEGNRNSNLIKLAFALNDFGIDKREAENVLFQFEEKDFDRKEIQTICDSAYRRVANFGSRFFEDKDEVERVGKMVKNGKDEQAIFREFSSFDRGQIRKVIETVKDNIFVENFWEFTKNGAVQISPHKYKRWLESNGFFKFYPNGGGYAFVRKEQNLLSITDTTRIKDFVLNYLESSDDIGFLPYDHMAASKKYFEKEFLTFLKTEDVKTIKDTKDICYLYFANGVVEIKQAKVELIDYIDVPSFVWKDQIINRDFNKTNEKGDFENFVWKLSSEDGQHFESIQTVIGYLCHNFNDMGNMKAIIINDEDISENPNGGSGKSLLGMAIDKVRKMALIDGKSYKHDDKFKFQTIRPDTQVVIFDDVLKNFNLELLFSTITNGMQIEYKNMPAIKLNYDETPKLLITTNYTVSGTGSSFERRRHEIEVSNYFNHIHTPFKEFGKMFFQDWDHKEWAKFDSFMIRCIQKFLKHGLIQHDFKNLDVRKFIKDTSFEFYEWVHDTERINLPINQRMNKQDKYQHILEEYPDFKKWLKEKTFSKWLKNYAIYKGFKFFEGKSNMRWFEYSTDDKEPETIDEVSTNDCPF